MKSLLNQVHSMNASGIHSIACDVDASEHYGIKPSMLWRMRCYIKGFVTGANYPAMQDFMAAHDAELAQVKLGINVGAGLPTALNES